MEKMNILAPELVWIEGHCFRKLAVKDQDNEPREIHVERRMSICEESSFNEDDNFDLPIKHEGNRFFITITIPEALVRFIKGKKGAKQKELENLYSTQIKIPPDSKKNIDADIIIVGRIKENVAKAYNRIDSICKDMRWKVGEYTHFLSIPMNDPSIVEGFKKFKNEVLSKYKSCQGINENIFENAPKLHITIAMLTLLNEREKETASGVLKKCKNEIMHVLGEKDLQIQIKGVEIMNDDPTDVDVLYGIVQEMDSDNRLQLIADNLADTFAKTYLSRNERSGIRDHIKLHVTLMKSRPTDNSYNTFDATKVLKEYAEYTFGQMTVKEVHLSVRYSGGTDYYYTANFVLNLT